MKGIKAYQSRFDEGGWRVFLGTLEEVRRRGRNYIFPAHVIKCLADADGGLFGQVLRALGAGSDAFRTVVERRIESSPRHTGGDIRLDAETIKVLKLALLRAHTHGREKISAADLLVALSQDEQGEFISIFRELGTEPDAVMREVRAAVDGRDRETCERMQPSTVEGAPHLYEVGDAIRIKGGAFCAMTAKVASVDYERLKLKAKVILFGRRRTIELDFSEVEKLSFERA
jgi:ATP-dependent Clp protease ATP-binding subunit ClpA